MKRCAIGSQMSPTLTTCSGSALGPHPYPMMVRDFQSVIGQEARAQILEREGRLPDVLDRLCRRRLKFHRTVLSIP